jgi:hypothetical protein
VGADDPEHGRKTEQADQGERESDPRPHAQLPQARESKEIATATRKCNQDEDYSNDHLKSSAQPPDRCHGGDGTRNRKHDEPDESGDREESEELATLPAKRLGHSACRSDGDTSNGIPVGGKQQVHGLE